MPDPATTKRVLARLAQRPVDRVADSTLFTDETEYRTVVDTATSAVERLDEAAAFVEAGGLDRLDAAIDDAVAAEDHAAARRGRRAREQFAQFRAAASGDHFHSGRATTLRGGVERDDT